jgi:hypothetical protein
MTDRTPSRRHPDAQMLGALHHAVVAGELGASEALAQAILPLICDRLRYRRVAEPDAVLTAAEDAVLDYLRVPTRFDPTRSRLDVYLARLAEWRMVNQRRALTTARRELQVEPVILDRLSRSRQPTEAGIECETADLERQQRILALARSSTEHQFLSASIRGATIADLGRLLGASPDSLAEQRRLVHSMIQRLRQRATRAKR